ncbi:hypothetical protein IFR05_017430, partial [Cadophora sp. M221]
MLPSYILFLLLSWTSKAWSLSLAPSPPDLCFKGCELALGIFSFNTTNSNSSNSNSTTPDDLPHDHRSRAEKECTNPFKIPSLYLCLKIYCTEAEHVEGLRAKNETCRGKGVGVSLPPWEIVE